MVIRWRSRRSPNACGSRDGPSLCARVRRSSATAICSESARTKRGTRHAEVGARAASIMRDQIDPWGERLPRRLGVWSSVAILIGTTIGSGIFRVPAIVAAQTQDPIVALLAWVLGGMISLCGALTIAELASALPRSGGIFAYILEGFGPWPAFLYGWAEMTVIRPAALGGIATIFAEYGGYFVTLGAREIHLLAAGAIAVVGTVNYIGLQPVARRMHVLTIVQSLTLAALAMLGF